MAFALYSGEKALGFFPIRAYCGIAGAAEKYGRSRKGKGTIPFLLAFFGTGGTEEPSKVAEDQAKREGPLRIPLLFEEVISDVSKVKAERKPAINKRKKRTRV